MMPMIAPCFSGSLTLCSRMAKLKTSAPSARVLSQLLACCSLATGPEELRDPARSDEGNGALRCSFRDTHVHCITSRLVKTGIKLGRSDI
jgi:hypothetical protein